MGDLIKASIIKNIQLEKEKPVRIEENKKNHKKNAK